MSDNTEFRKELEERTKQINEQIESYLPEEKGHQKTIFEAMNYSVKAGGKRLRPLFMQEICRLFTGEVQPVVVPFMAAIEMIHTYSLVHDDLPAMDNDEYRRGRKTTWSVYGDGMGVLAGDGLLNYAFETAFRAFPAYAAGKTVDENYPRVAAALNILARKAGIYGMIGGQTADLEAEGKQITEEQLLFIYRHKTADLIEASMMIGAILAGADEKTVTAMGKCAYNIGIAFQIQDDILDVEGEEAVLGKPLFSDEKNDKQTYVTMYGLEKAKKEVEKLSEEAICILKDCSGDSAFLEELTKYLIHRKK